MQSVTHRAHDSYLSDSKTNPTHNGQRCQRQPHPARGPRHSKRRLGVSQDNSRKELLETTRYMRFYAAARGESARSPAYSRPRAAPSRAWGLGPGWTQKSRSKGRGIMMRRAMIAVTRAGCSALGKTGDPFAGPRENAPERPCGQQPRRRPSERAELFDQGLIGLYG